MYLFWLAAAFLTLVVTLATLRPLLRRHAERHEDRPAFDAAVYRAQLNELSADRERGVITQADAAVARAEIARRLLKAEAQRAEAVSEPASKLGNRPAIVASLVVALVLPAGTFLFYDREGSPQLGDQPLALRSSQEPLPDLGVMLSMIERRLADNPDDEAGWNVVAPIYLRTGQADKAIDAFENVLRLTDPTAQALAGLGEALVQKANGEVTVAASDAFRKALAIDPQWVPARFYTALQLSQTGQVDEASAAWAGLLGDAPADVPWRQIAEAALADAKAKALDGNVSERAVPGPTAEDIAAAEDLSPQDRQSMVDGMVAQLANRLDQAPDDAEGWKRLVRSYVVLGRKDQAESALQKALDAFPSPSTQRTDLIAFARSIGIENDVSTP